VIELSFRTIEEWLQLFDAVQLKVREYVPSYSFAT
jgi:hypothetical protein